MARRKKITRKKLREPDEFMSLTERAYLFVTHHLKQIVTGGIVLLVVVFIVIFFQRWEKKKGVDADQKFGLAVELYQRVGSPYREGSPAEYKNVLGNFDEVISKFPGTLSGKLSLLYQANIHLRLAEFGEAIKEYQAFLQKIGKEKLYRLLALEGMGYAYEGMKDYQKALQAFQTILEMGESFHLADAYLNIGTCYEKVGKNKEALENYRAFLKIADKSSMANAVVRKVSFLEK
jgi:tetratricopeptide (TPR) repeat protein